MRAQTGAAGACRRDEMRNRLFDDRAGHLLCGGRGLFICRVSAVVPPCRMLGDGAFEARHERGSRCSPRAERRVFLFISAVEKNRLLMYNIVV